MPDAEGPTQSQYGQRNEKGRLVADVRLEVWKTPEGTFVVRTEARDDQGRRHSGFVSDSMGKGWEIEEDAETVLRELVADLLRGK